MRCVLDGISEDTSKIFMSIKHSKLQLAILSLYKEFLRAGKRGPPGLQEYVRMRFREGAVKYKRSDVFMIEYELRKANRQLNELNSSSVTGFQVFSPRKKD
ncbi:unnamed protein product [Enterobius vermicularis]|uniref:Complex 1 protein n=1 Tax=Enterobius vermicularis TaxID=51028 RepID=A0A0N4VCL1_ENTVE|nr:unnamed protein product [Enterobius vermicularis]